MPGIGALNTRLKLQAKTVTSSTKSGAPTSSWTTQATLWASRGGGQGREFMRSDQPRSELRQVWTVHFRDGVTRRHRLVEADSTGRVWDIVTAFDPDGKRQWTEIHATLRDE